MASVSYQQIAGRLDAAAPIYSLNDLFARHRWESKGGPPPSRSFRTIARRHTLPETTFHRFLWYNTFLLEGWVLNLCVGGALKILIAAAGLTEKDVIKSLNMSPADVLKKAGVPKSKILDMFDISADDLASAFPSVFDAACKALSWVPVVGDIVCSASDALSEMLSRLSIEQIVDRFGLSLGDVLDKLEAWGFDLMGILEKVCDPVLALIKTLLGIDIPSTIKINPKPELKPRALEIGAIAGQDYDIACLCEVFSHARRMQLLSAAQAAGRPIQYVEGPDDSGDTTLADGGLFTLAFQRPILHSDWTIFDGDSRGEYFRDADAWANKGVLLTVVDVGVGHLEIYSTHLMNGGDLITVPAWVPVLNILFPELSPQERLALQLKQVDRLVAFYKKHHNPKNIALVVGDFNIAADVKNRYDALVAKMSAINMRDVWPYYRLPPIDPKQTPTPRGDSHSSNDEAGHSSSTVWKICQPSSATYCDEWAKTETTTSRIDYVFAENPTKHHTYMLDISRIRRRSFVRLHSGIQELYLSDHVGLEVSLIASPRKHVPA
jgi:endonuclease/exonuclease/phosphatase family metal-dependent hydrolase